MGVKLFKFGHLSRWYRGERDGCEPLNIDLVELLKNPDKPCLILLRPNLRKDKSARIAFRITPDRPQIRIAVMNYGHILERHAAYFANTADGRPENAVWYKLDNEDPQNMVIKKAETLTGEYTFGEMGKVGMDARLEFDGTFAAFIRLALYKSSHVSA